MAPAGGLDMASIPFDTLQFVKTLEAAGVPAPQAEAFSAAVRDSHEFGGVATKRDIDDLRKEMEGRLEKWSCAWASNWAPSSSSPWAHSWRYRNGQPELFLAMIPFLNHPCPLSASLAVPRYCLRSAFAFPKDGKGEGEEGGRRLAQARSPEPHQPMAANCAWRALPPMPAASFGHFMWNQPPGGRALRAVGGRWLKRSAAPDSCHRPASAGFPCGP